MIIYTTCYQSWVIQHVCSGKQGVYGVRGWKRAVALQMLFPVIHTWGKNCPQNPVLSPFPVNTEATIAVLTRQRELLISWQIMSLLPLASGRGRMSGQSGRREM